MPRYDYKCPQCEFVDEVFHSMSESPKYECPDCQVTMKRLYTGINLNHGKCGAQKRIENRLRSEADMKQDMLENHGVENIVPLQKATVTDVYKEVKAGGDSTRDVMQAQTEISHAKRDAKTKEWKKGAMRRSPQRSRELVQRRAAEAAQKRAIRL